MEVRPEEFPLIYAYVGVSLTRRLALPEETFSVPFEAPTSAAILSVTEDEFTTTNETWTPGSLVIAVFAL
jgi:hypothetical protein